MVNSTRLRRGLRAGALALVLAAAGAAGAGDPVSAASDASQPFIVKVHADWCGTCQRLTPTIEALQGKPDLGARIVVLDVTDQAALARAAAEAERLGLGAFFERYKAKTGTVGVLNGASREEVAVLKGVTDVARYEAAVREARGPAS